MPKTNYDWIIAENGLSAFRCERCHDRYVVGLPCGFDMMLAMMESFKESHKDCKAPDGTVTIIDTSIKDLELIADYNMTVALRKAHGIRQAEVAEAMGKSRATVVAIEQGESKSIFWAYRLHVHGLIAKVQVTEEAKIEMARCPGGIHCGPCQKCLNGKNSFDFRDQWKCGYNCPKHSLGITHLNRAELEKTLKKYLDIRGKEHVHT